MIMKKILLCILITLPLHIGFSESPLKVGFFDFPPYEYVEGDENGGISTLLVKEIFSRMGLEAEYLLLPWSRALRMIESGEIDAVFEILFKDEREAFIDYSREVLMEEASSLFALDSARIPYTGTLDSIQSYRLVLIRDFSYGNSLDIALEAGFFPNVEYSPDIESSVRMLLGGRADILIGDSYGTKVLFHQEGVFESVEELGVVEVTPTYMGFSKANRLEKIRDEFDRTLAEIKGDGTYQRILEESLIQP